MTAAYLTRAAAYAGAEATDMAEPKTFLIHLDGRLSPREAETISVHERTHLKATGAAGTHPGWDEVERFERECGIGPQLPARPEVRKSCGHVRVYEDPGTSEIAAEFLFPREALAHLPKPGAEVIQNGTVLFREKGGRWVGVKAVLLHRGGDFVVLSPGHDGEGDFEYDDGIISCWITGSEAREQEASYVEDGWEKLA